MHISLTSTGGVRAVHAASSGSLTQAEKTGPPAQAALAASSVIPVATATTAYGWPKRRSATRRSARGGLYAENANMAVTAAASKPVREYFASAACLAPHLARGASALATAPKPSSGGARSCSDRADQSGSTAVQMSAGLLAGSSRGEQGGPPPPARPCRSGGRRGAPAARARPPP